MLPNEPMSRQTRGSPLQVDCEQTAANQDLAAASGIRAFPTFHLYRCVLAAACLPSALLAWLHCCSPAN